MPALMIQAPDQASPALHAALYAEWQKFRDGTAPVDPEYIPPFILASWEALPGIRHYHGSQQHCTCGRAAP